MSTSSTARKHGHVVSINAHHTMPGMSTVSVAHGRRKRPKKDQKQPGATPFAYDDRPTSTVHVPNAEAKQYRIGQRVSVGMQNADASEGGAGDAQDLDADQDPLSELDEDTDDIGAAKASATRNLGNARARPFGR